MNISIFLYVDPTQGYTHINRETNENCEAIELCDPVPEDKDEFISYISDMSVLYTELKFKNRIDNSAEAKKQLDIIKFCTKLIHPNIKGTMIGAFINKENSKNVPIYTSEIALYKKFIHIDVNGSSLSIHHKNNIHIFRLILLSEEIIYITEILE